MTSLNVFFSPTVQNSNSQAANRLINRLQPHRHTTGRLARWLTNRFYFNWSMELLRCFIRTQMTDVWRRNVALLPLNCWNEQHELKCSLSRWDENISIFTKLIVLNSSHIWLKFWQNWILTRICWCCSLKLQFGHIEMWETSQLTVQLIES